MLDSAKFRIGFHFDHMISVAETGYFKPHPAAYRAASERLDVDPGSIMHLANHAFDCIGAKAVGMHAAFVNRRRVPL
jgi:2-haloacid dehalogenase